MTSRTALLWRKLRTATRVYREQGLGHVNRLTTQQASNLWRAVRFVVADATRDTAGRAALVSQVINFRQEFGHLSIDQHDLAGCRQAVLTFYVLRRFELCADLCSAHLGELTPIELCLYADCLYRRWDFSKLVQLRDVIHARLAGTKFAHRAEQILRRALLRTGRLTEAADGLGCDRADADVGDFLLCGDVWDALGRMDAARQAYRRAIRKDSENAMLRLHYAFHLMKNGDVLDGLTSWGIADRMFGTYPLRPHRLRWRGEALDGRTLLVVFEHGLGDMIQFARFLEPLRRRWPSARVIGRVPLVLRDLLANSFPGVTFVSRKEEEPAYDFYVPSVQLPSVLEASSLEPATGYIRLRRPNTPSPADGARERFKVGICWRGHPREYEQVRSVPLKRFASLFAQKDKDFVVLLNKLTEEETLLLKGYSNVSIPQIDDFAGLGEVMAECDLVVSVDTAVAHVAAAAGRPVLLLARPDSCWRWGPSQETSPWYPTVQVLRHPVDLDWDVVLGKAAELLAERSEPVRGRMIQDGPIPPRAMSA